MVMIFAKWKFFFARQLLLGHSGLSAQSIQQLGEASDYV
jgi:hypothetical protein